MIIVSQPTVNHLNLLGGENKFSGEIQDKVPTEFKFDAIFNEKAFNSAPEETRLEQNNYQIEQNSYQIYEKPNLKDFVTKIYGETPNEIYDRSPKEYEEVCLAASELLYGVVGSIDDSRDWSRIMNSADPVRETRKQTQELHGAYVEIESVKLTDGSEVQLASLKNNYGMTLRGIDADKVEDIEFMLKNFGLSEGSISSEVISKVDASMLHRSIKQALVNFAAGEA